MVFQNDILAGASGTGGYTIDQSIRFNDNDSAYMSATLGTATDTDVYTISLWVKRGNLGLLNYIFSAGPVSTITEDFIGFQSNDTIFVRWAGTTRLATTQVFRDPSAWYHVILACDYGASGSDKAKLYINGAEVTAFGTDTRSSITGTNQRWNTATLHYFGRNAPAGGQYLDGYLSEINFIDGQALDPTSFGEYDSVSGVWIPKAYAGTYGTNGFYITGADSADLGADYSGNGNNFTSSGLTSDDQMLDTPTKNYPTYSPISTLGTLSDGNLVLSIQDYACPITQSYPTSGIWQTDFELDVTSGSNGAGVGVLDFFLFKHRTSDASYTDGSLAWGGSYGFGADGTLNSPSAYNIAYGSNWFTAGNIISIIYNADVGAVWFAINGTLQNSATGAEIEAGTTTNAAFTGLTGSIYTPFTWSQNSANRMILLNENQQSISGLTSAKTLFTANLPTPTIKDGSAHFNIVQYTGTGNVTRSVTGVGFQPDLVYNKQRNNTSANVIANAVSGANTFMATEQTTAESSFTNSIYGYLSSFDSDGYTLTPGSTNNNYWNENAINFVSYNWLAGNGTASNTDGSITSTVSANQTAGFSIVTYTGTGSAATVGHGLSTTPEMIIVKNRSASWGWFVYNSYLANPTTGRLQLNLTNAEIAGGTPGPWNNTAPTSTVFSIGDSSFPEVNGSGNSIVAYCFASVEGFSKFGKYTGNGSADGPFVWCGFRPAFILVKEYTSADDWLVYDTSRDTYNVAGQVWRPDSNAAEFDGRGGSRDMDILSNGFKFRSSNGTMNGSGVGYIFMAFAEHPFGGSGVAPVPAR